MTTPRNSMSGAFPADPMKGPVAMQPVKRPIPRKMSPVVGPTQSFFMRESKALGAVQIMNGLFHIALGGLLMIHMEVYVPICVTVWYPLWGGVMYIISGSLLAAAETNSRKSLVKGKMIMNSLSLFAAISGIILLIMDIFNITVSHFFKMESPNFINTPVLSINVHNCEPANPAEKNSLHLQYCYRIRSVFLSLFTAMLIFAFFQKLVAAGTVESEWKKLCSKPKAGVVLLSAEERREAAAEKREAAAEKLEAAAELREAAVEMPEAAAGPPSEDDAEAIPILEEEEETELNFPEPPHDPAPSPTEGDCAP